MKHAESLDIGKPICSDRKGRHSLFFILGRFFLIMAFYAFIAGIVNAQTLQVWNGSTWIDGSQFVTGTPVGDDYGRYNAATYTKMVMSGTFTPEQMYQVACFTKGSGGEYRYVSVNNNYITEVDMSGLRLGAGDWVSANSSYGVSGFIGFLANFAELITVTLPDIEITTEVSLDHLFGIYTGNSLASTKLTTINNLENFTNVVSFNNTFRKCKMLTSTGFKLPAGSGSTVGVDFSLAFDRCESLTTPPVNFEKFNNITKLQSVFQVCSNLEYVNFSENQTAAGSINLGSAFVSCGKLRSVTNLDKFTNGVNNMFYTFAECYELREITLPRQIAASGAINFDGTFEQCHELVFIHNLETYSYSNFDYTFYQCHSLAYVQLGDISTLPPAEYDEIFLGMNPNCLIYLPEGSTPDPKWLNVKGNFIIGNTTYDDIILQDTFKADFEALGFPTKVRPCNYHCPIPFTIASGHTIKYTRDFTGQSGTPPTYTQGWQSITLPFDAVVNANEIDPCAFTGDYFLAEYKESSADGVLAFDVVKTSPNLKANTPYLIYVGSNRSFTFTGNESLVIPATPVTANVSDYFAGNPSASNIRKEDANGRFTHYGTFLPVRKTNYYLVNETDGDYFTLDSKSIGFGADGLMEADGTTPANWASFRAYFQAEEGAPSLSKLSVGKINGALCNTGVDIKVLLEGPMMFRSSMMHNYMQSDVEEETYFTTCVIPVNNPYGVTGTSYPQITDVNGPAGKVVDWIKIEVINIDFDEYTYSVLETKACLLQPDGSIVETDGTKPVFSAHSDPVYLLISHHSYMPIISVAINDLTVPDLSIDFRTDPDIKILKMSSGHRLPMLKVYETTGAGAVSYWAMIAGDLTQDGRINTLDKNIFNNALNAGRSGQYEKADFNADGRVNSQDTNRINTNMISGIISAIYFLDKE